MTDDIRELVDFLRGYDTLRHHQAADALETLTARLEANKFFYVKHNNRRECFQFVKVRKRHCQLHGDFIGWEVHGRRIKASGRLEGSTSVFDLESLERDCRNQIAALTEQGRGDTSEIETGKAK